jgi:hypothetical protein
VTNSPVVRGSRIAAWIRTQQTKNVQVSVGGRRDCGQFPAPVIGLDPLEVTDKVKNEGQIREQHCDQPVS